jgi:hypothetical protein
MCYKHIVGFSKKGVHVINYRTTKIIVEQASESARTRVKEDYFFSVVYRTFVLLNNFGNAQKLNVNNNKWGFKLPKPVTLPPTPFGIPWVLKYSKMLRDESLWWTLGKFWVKFCGLVSYTRVWWTWKQDMPTTSWGFQWVSIGGRQSSWQAPSKFVCCNQSIYLITHL